MMRKALCWTIPITLLVLGVVYVAFGYPAYVVRWNEVDMNSGRIRRSETYFGFTVSIHEEDTDASRFISTHLATRPPPKWWVFSQDRPFDSTRRDYFTSYGAVMALRELMERFPEMSVPLPDQIAMMQATIDATATGIWVQVLADDDSLAVIAVGNDKPIGEWRRPGK